MFKIVSWSSVRLPSKILIPLCLVTPANNDFGSFGFKTLYGDGNCSLTVNLDPRFISWFLLLSC